MKHSLNALLILLLFLLQAERTEAGEKELEELIRKMEDEVLGFARQVEVLYKNRCDDTSLEQCYQGNYKNCLSEFPSQQCIAGEDYAQPACGTGDVCSSLWDFTTSVVRLPEDLTDRYSNPIDKQVIETVCFTQTLDDWLVRQYKANLDYWNGVNVPPPWYHYGAHNGVYRIYPARQSKDCGLYDPRERPWYIAASSGPKNVILILDTSGSMRGFRLELMKQAATQVIKSLTVSDRVAIVEFGSTGTLHAYQSQYFFEASDKNKDTLIEVIGGLSAVGGTNFQEAFQKAFLVLDSSIKKEFHVNCNTAILFLTDGIMTEPTGVDETILESTVLRYVSDNLLKYEEKLKRPIFLFTYSISEDADVHVFPKKIACSATENGVWSKIVDDKEIFESLTSYFLLFTIGLGVDKNENFTAWVEPYTFATGGILGTTVSAPVYDRSKDPPLFLGVAGLDFSMAAVDKALGVEEGSQESINRIVRTSTARCPNIDLTLCEIESFRRRGSAGNGALCTDNCTATDFVAIEEEACGTISDYPEDVWADQNYADLSYFERTCCKVGEDRPSDECPPNDNGNTSATGVIVGGVVGGAVGAFVLGYGCMLCTKNRPEQQPLEPDIAFRKADIVVPAKPVFAASPIVYPLPSAPPAENPKYVISESDSNP